VRGGWWGLVVSQGGVVVDWQVKRRFAEWVVGEGKTGVLVCREGGLRFAYLQLFVQVDR